MAQIPVAFYKLVNETGKQAIETTGNVAQSGLKATSSVAKGVAEASKSVESAGKAINSAGKILNSTAKIGYQTVNSLQSLSKRAQKSINEKTQKLESNSNARLRAMNSQNYINAKNNLERERILQQVDKEKLKLQKEKAYLESKKIIIDQQLEIKKKEAQIKATLTKAQMNIKQQQQQARINRNSKSQNALLIIQLKKDYIEQVNEECNIVIIAFKSLLTILCDITKHVRIYGYCKHNYYGRPIFTKIKNVQQKYNSYINHLKLLIKNTFETNQSKIIDYINNKIDITRILNRILISKINDINKLIQKKINQEKQKKIKQINKKNEINKNSFNTPFNEINIVINTHNKMLKNKMLNNEETYKYNTEKKINNKEMNEILNITNINHNSHNGKFHNGNSNGRNNGNPQ